MVSQADEKILLYGGLILGGIVLWKSDFFGKVGGGIGDIGSGLGGGLNNLGSGLGGGLYGLGSGLGGGLYNIGAGVENVGAGFENVGQGFEYVGEGLGYGIGEFLSGWGKFGTTINTPWGSFAAGANVNQNNSDSATKAAASRGNNTQAATNPFSNLFQSGNTSSAKNTNAKPQMSAGQMAAAKTILTPQQSIIPIQQMATIQAINKLAVKR